jgi:hypothetical protein
MLYSRTSRNNSAALADVKLKAKNSTMERASG